MRRSAFILAVLVASIAVISASDRRSLRPATRLRGLMALFGSTTDPSSSNNPTTSNTSKENSKTTTTPNPNPNRSIPLGTPGGTANGGTGNAKEVTTGTGTSAKSTPANITASKPSSNGNDKGSGNTDDSESKGKRNTCDDQSYCCGNPGQCHTHPKYCTWCSDNCCCDPCNPSCWNYDKCDKKGCGNVCSDCPTKPACENGRPKNCCWQSYGPGNNNGVCRDAGACNGGGECTSANCSAPKSCKDGQCVCVKDKAGAQCNTGGKCWDGSSCPDSCTCPPKCDDTNCSAPKSCKDGQQGGRAVQHRWQVLGWQLLPRLVHMP
jgi:hypothetical protein